MTTASTPATAAIDRVLAGDVRVAARLMRDIDDRTPAAGGHVRKAINGARRRRRA